MRRIFWNEEQKRLRTLWRLLLALLLGMVLIVVLSILGGILATFLLGPDVTGQLEALLRQGTTSFVVSPYGWFSLAFTGVVIVVTVIGSALLFDRRPVGDLGLHLDKAWWSDLGFGLGLGALLMTGIFLAEWALGWVTVSEWAYVAGDRYPFWVILVGGLIAYLLVGIYEELVARGYILRNLAEGLDAPWWGKCGAVILAWLLSSVIFGLAHATNPNAAWFSTIALMVAGLSLGFGYVLTGELGIPIGLHITWNFFQGIIYGFPVSGMASPGSLIGTVQRGPDLWTGGPFGPEAGLISGIAIVLGMALTWLWVRRRRGTAGIQRDIATAPMPKQQDAAEV